MSCDSDACDRVDSYYKRCDGCHEFVLRKNLNEKSKCEACILKEQCKCKMCFSHNDACDSNEIYKAGMCTDCYFQRYNRCDGCDEFFLTETLTTDRWTTKCEACILEEMLKKRTCSSCGMESETPLAEVLGYYYCHECNDSGGDNDYY
jgi:hypothetical protein